MGVRSRVGFRPNTPHWADGMRIEPPPSVACAAGSMRAATAAVAPPLEPPPLRSKFQGFRIGPRSCDSVVPQMPELRRVGLGHDH